MNQQRDIERLLDRWLAEGPTVVADRVIDVIADRIERQSQRRAWRLRLAQRRVDVDLRFAAVVSAVVVAVGILGFSLGGGFTAPSTSPSPATRRTDDRTNADAPGDADAEAAGSPDQAIHLVGQPLLDLVSGRLDCQAGGGGAPLGVSTVAPRLDGRRAVGARRPDGALHHVDRRSRRRTGRQLACGAIAPA